MTFLWLTRKTPRHRDQNSDTTCPGFNQPRLTNIGGFLREACRYFSPIPLIYRCLSRDQDHSNGCILLPGGDAPERVVFERLRQENWRHLWTKISRDLASVVDACERAMLLENHHEWVLSAANTLMCGGDVLWQAMCSEWSDICRENEVSYIRDEIGDLLN